MKRGAIALSVNAIIIIILSIIIFAAGIALLYQFISSAEETQDLLNQQLVNSIESRLVQQNKLVVLPFNTAVLNAGDNKIFGLGFKNIEEERQFTVEIKLSAGSPMPGDPSWFLYENTYLVKENDIQNVAIRSQVPNEAEAGIYIFNVEVKVDGIRYGNRQKLNIEVR